MTVGGVPATSVVVVSATSITAVTPVGTAGAKTVAVTTAGGTGTSVGAFTYTDVALPTISSVAPSSGPTTGSTAITITGTNLTGASSVTVGGTAATSVVVVSATSITAVTPVGTAGAKTVSVTTGLGTANSTNAFTYVAAPTIASVSPSSGPLAAGTAITITGTNLTGATVTVDGAAATSVVVASATSITAVTPSGTAGAKDVVVTTIGGVATSTGAFTYVAAPTVSSVTPTSGPLAGGTVMTVVGTGFVNGSTTVLIDSTFECTSVNVLAPTLLQATTPSGTVGSKSVKVRTAGGTVTAVSTFTYAAAPTIASVSPSSGPLSAGTAITITGTNLTNASSVTVGGVAATSVVVASATSITAVTPTGTAGAKTIVVTTAGGSTSQAITFTYVAAPTIASVSPSSGPLAAGTAITITGTNLSGATVTVGGAAATSVVVNGSGTSLTAATPVGTAGAKDVVVTTVGGAATSTGAFTYVSAPTIASVSPSSGPLSAGTAITITGTNLTGATSVTVGGVAATSVVVASATSITAVTPTGTAGAKTIVVTTVGGSTSQAITFTYVAAPTIASVSPSSGPLTAGTAITITGTNLTGATVTVGGAAATSVVVNGSGTSLTAGTPAGTSGAQNVVVTTVGGAVTSTGAFTYVAAPTIASVSPTTGSALGATPITITGTNLTGVTVTVGGAAATSVTVNGAGTSLTAVTPAGTVGAQNVVVTNVGGTATLTGGFTYFVPAPTIASLSPNSGTTLGGTPITISGTNFTGASSVTFGGAAATSVVVVSATSITAVTPSGAEGAQNVSVTTAGGTATATAAFTYLTNAPTITGVVPNSGPFSGGTTITLTGTNFTDASRVTIGGIAATSFAVVNATTITAVTASGTDGLQSVAVTTPISTVTKTNAFTYVVPAPVGVAASDGASTSQVTVTWSAVAGAVTGYDIFRNGGATKIGSSVGVATTYADTTAVAGTLYSYTVKTTSATGISVASAADNGWVKLSAPTGVACATPAVADGVHISWNASVGATSYDIFRDGGATKIGSSLGTATTYVDTTATVGVNFTYTVRAVCTLGSSDLSAGAIGWMAPSAPTGVAASDGTSSTQVTVIWVAATGATSYDIFRDGGATKIGSSVGTATTYTDTTVPAATTHTYTVKAVTALGSSVASAGDTGYTVLESPLNVAATDGTSFAQVGLSWSSVPGATGYQIIRSDSVTALTTTTGNAATSFNDTTATIGQIFTYSVKATATDPKYISAATVDSGHRAIESPTSVAATDSVWTNKIFVSWSAVNGAVAYQVFRDGAATPIATLAGNSNTSFGDSSTTVGTVYTYTVKAQGPDVFSLASLADTGVRAVAATMVEGVSATDGAYTDKVIVTWKASPGAIGYQVYRNGIAAPIGTVSASSLSYNDTGAGIGVSYTYCVKAFTIGVAQLSNDSAGLSVVSASDAGYRAPSAPLNVQATDGTLSDQVRVTWDQLTTVLGYKIYRDGVEVGSTPLDSITTFSDSSATVEQKYTYTVKAVTATGLSAVSAGDSGFRGLPPGPIGVAASDGVFSDKVQVTWTKLVGCTAYQIFRDGALVGTTTGYSSVTYNDTTAAVTVVYTYTVKGVVYGGLTQASAGNTGFRGASLTSGQGGPETVGSIGSTSSAKSGSESVNASAGNAGNDLGTTSTTTVAQADDAAGSSNDSADLRTTAQMKCDALFLDVSQRMQLSDSFAREITPLLGVDDDLDGVMDMCQRNQGDFNLDGAVNDSDLVDLMRAFQLHDAIADLNLDGEFDGSDIALFLMALDDHAEQAAFNGESAIKVLPGEMDQLNASQVNGAIVGGSNISDH